MFIISRYYPKIFIDLNCDPCEINEADYCIISDYDGIESLSEVKKLNFFQKNEIFESLEIITRKEDLFHSYLIGKEYQNSIDNIVIIF